MTTIFTVPIEYDFESIMTIRLRSCTVTRETQSDHYKSYVELIDFMRSMRAKGWRLESVETIEKEAGCMNL